MPEAQLFLDQTGMTVHTYLHQAIKSIDEAFGDGYSKQHPELVGAFIQACALDFHTGWSTQEIRSALNEIAEAIHSRDARALD